MSSHSPGPWRIADDGRTIVDAHGQPVRGCVVMRMTGADAAIIVAAPELLAACKAAVDWMPKRLDERADEAREMLIKAIAKTAGAACGACARIGTNDAAVTAHAPGCHADTRAES